MATHIKRKHYTFTLGRAVERLESAELPKLASAQLRLAQLALKERDTAAASARILAAEELIAEQRRRGEQLRLV